MDKGFLERQRGEPPFPTEQCPDNSNFAGEPNLARKRVLLLFPHMVMQGGALNYMLKLAELLMKKGAIVGILTLQADLQKYGSATGAEILPVGGPVTSNLS